MKTRTAQLTAMILQAIAFDDNKAGWKIGADGKCETKDGKPIYLDATGAETTFDYDRIAVLNNEAATNRRKLQDTEKLLEPYKGLDAAAARKAIEDLAKIDQKKLIDAGEVDKVREAISATFTAQIAEKDKAYASLRDELDGLRVSNIFANSEFLRDRLAMPRDVVEAYFRSNFKIDKDGKISAFYKDGNPVMSKQAGNIGGTPTTDEALQLLIEAHPQKDMFLKADTGNGSGNNGNGGHRPGSRTMKRADFNQLSQAAQAQAAEKANKGELTIVD